MQVLHRHTSSPFESDPEVPSDPPTATALGGLALTALLAACGGGGGDSGTAVAATPTPSPGPAAAPTEAQAARFLGQASFAAIDADVARVQALGYAGWLDEQMNAAPSQSRWDWMVSKGWADVGFRNTQTGLDNMLWRKLISSPDVLRQRIVLALTEIFVVSPLGIPIGWRQFSCAAYLDMLEARCFGNFRDLLDAVTLSSAMGVYLNMRGNQRENLATGRVPDENYAREVLQLFTIGLYELNPDGSQKKTPGGATIETYDQATVTGLAKVFTGWDFSTVGPALTDAPDRLRAQMEFVPSRFSPSEKRFLGVTIPGSTDGVIALKTALDTIFNHPNVGPFFGRQLIQRLVTSNPSPAYVARVAAAFNGGVRGDLRAVIRAVLLDPEARTASPPTDPNWGKVREPVLRFVQWARTFTASSSTDVWGIGDTTDPATRLGQSPLRSPSVFNFFRPGYVPPNTSFAASGRVAPELQITNESTVVGYANYMQTRIQSGIADVLPNYAAEQALADDVTKLVDRVATRLAGGTISEATLASIRTAVGTISAATDAGRLNRVRATIMLVLCAPEYLVQK